MLLKLDTGKRTVVRSIICRDMYSIIKSPSCEARERTALLKHNRDRQRLIIIAGALTSALRQWQRGRACCVAPKCVVEHGLDISLLRNAFR
jgi:hypothetical protein